MVFRWSNSFAGSDPADCAAFVEAGQDCTSCLLWSGQCFGYCFDRYGQAPFLVCVGRASVVATLRMGVLYG